MKRKSELLLALDDMFSEDDKKRINAIKSLDLVSSNLGPQRTRDQLVPFLSQFVEDTPSVMLEVVQQIQKIKPYLGGPQYEKKLIPLLISFCMTDETEVAEAATSCLQSILMKQTSEYVDVVKKLARQEMTVASKCMAKLIISGLEKVPHLQPTFLQIFKSLIFSKKAAIRIVGCKHLQKINEKIKNKEQISKILQILYNDIEDLPKLLTIDTLISFYPINSNFVMSKLKILIATGKWRYDLKLCEYANQLSSTLNKNHFKSLIEPAFLNMMKSPDIQIMAKSCQTLPAIAKNMSHEQNQEKLMPILESINSNKSLQVKASLAKNIISIFPYISATTLNEKVLPITFSLLKQNKLEISTGIIEKFNNLAEQLKTSEEIESMVIKPLINQLKMDDWRLRVSMLNILGTLIINETLDVPAMLDLLINGCLDRVEAIRKCSTKIIISIIKNKPEEWTKTKLIPKFNKVVTNPHYLIRQKILVIIQQTAGSVKKPILDEYKAITSLMLKDKTPNIRMMSMKVVICNQNLLDKVICSQLVKMKEDPDTQIKQAAKTIKV